MLRVKLASEPLYKGNIPVCTIPTLPTKEIAHKETMEQIVVEVVIPPQEDIHPCEQSKKEEKHHSSIQRKINTPPLLTKEERNQILSIQPTSKPFCKEYMYMCSTVDLSTNAFSHTKSTEHTDADTKISSQEDLVLKSSPTHQDNGS